MFRIGEFSKLAQVSGRLLRYYDELGLFSPEHTDPQSGYRVSPVTSIWLGPSMCRLPWMIPELCHELIAPISCSMPFAWPNGVSYSPSSVKVLAQRAASWLSIAS